LDTSGTKTEGACEDGASEMEVYTVNNKNHLLCKYLIGWQVSGVGGKYILLPFVHLEPFFTLSVWEF